MLQNRFLAQSFGRYDSKVQVAVIHKKNVLPHRVNILLNIPPAIFLANPPEYNALDAKFDAWLNLSHLENATVLVIVRISAMTVDSSSSAVAPVLVQIGVLPQTHQRPSATQI